MGYWLLMFFFIITSCIVIDNWFDERKPKLLGYFVVVMIFSLFVQWFVQDWEKRTIKTYKLEENYLVLEYMTTQTEHIAYQDIENIKFVMGKGSQSCGLSFYIKGKANIRTLSNLECKQIGKLQNQIYQKR